MGFGMLAVLRSARKGEPGPAHGPAEPQAAPEQRLR